MRKIFRDHSPACIDVRKFNRSLIRIVLFWLTLLAFENCSDPNAENDPFSNESLTEKFLRQKGKLKPIDNYISSSNLCLNNSQPIFSMGQAIQNRQVFTSEDNARIMAVADGIVRLVKQVHEKNLVMIQHGQYFTVYIGLDNVKVAPGDKVTRGTKLGRPRYSGTLTECEFWFQIYHGMEELNPDEWIEFSKYPY